MSIICYCCDKDVTEDDRAKAIPDMKTYKLCEDCYVNVMHDKSGGPISDFPGIE